MRHSIYLLFIVCGTNIFDSCGYPHTRTYSHQYLYCGSYFYTGHTHADIYPDTHTGWPEDSNFYTWEYSHALIIKYLYADYTNGRLYFCACFSKRIL